jgi:hypothetical protein
MGKSRLPAAITALLLIAAIALATKFLGWRTFPIAAFAVGAASVVLCVALRNDAARNSALALGVGAIAVGLVDLFLRVMIPVMSYGIAMSDGLAESYGTPSDRDRQFRATAWRSDNGDPIYDVTYTLDRNGYRRTAGAPPGAPTVLFFGDSFTFGMGLEDEETIPSQFSASLGKPYTVLNLGYPGFGPHRVLRAIESDSFATAVSGKVRRAYFVIIRDHLRRSVGLTEWNQKSPRYVLDANDIPRFIGHFVDDPLAQLLNRLDLAGGLPRLTGSMLAHVVYPESYRVVLTAAIVARSADLLKTRYGTELVVLLWDEVAVDDIESALAERGVRTVLVSHLLRDAGGRPLFDSLNHSALHILQGIEDHPSATADRIIGAALARWDEVNSVSPSATSAQVPVGADRP